MTVGELIEQLSHLDPDTKIVVPGAPYNQPNPLYMIGGVVLEEDDPDTGIPKGIYIGLNMGIDFDDDTILDEEPIEPEKPIEEEEEIIVHFEETKIEASNMTEFISGIKDLIEKDKL